MERQSRSKMRAIHMRKPGVSAYALSLCLISLLCSSDPAPAEMYIAGQAGATLPNAFSDVKLSGSNYPQGGTMTDTPLKSSVMYGGKLGYYFESLKWLGIETEVFTATPHAKQYMATATVPAGSATFVQPGGSVRATTWAFNLLVRHQMGNFEPYAGIGPGIFFASYGAPNGAGGMSNASDTSIGLNTQLGLRYRLTDHVALFGEWKYNSASMKFDRATLPGTNIEGQYSAHILAVGLGYHF